MIQISDHPVYGFGREVNPDILIITIDGKNEVVVLRVHVSTFDNDGVEISELAKDVDLVADNTTKVNSMGEIVPEFLEDGTPNPDAVMGEYDFFKLLESQPVIINDLKISKVIWADQNNRL